MANEKAGSSGHWRKTKGLLWTTLAIWAFFAFVIHWFGPSLNGIPGESFPGAYYMAGQGSQIAFVLLIFWFVWRQGKIDDEHGVSE